MSFSIIAPAISGLIVGTALIILFAAFSISSARPTLISDTEIPRAISVTKDIAEVRTIVKRYSDVKVQICTPMEHCSQTQILYYKEKVYTAEGDLPRVKTRLGVAVGIDSDFKVLDVHAFCNVESESGSSFGTFPANPEDYV